MKRSTKSNTKLQVPSAVAPQHQSKLKEDL